jgi:hypothetical protein
MTRITLTIVFALFNANLFAYENNNSKYNIKFFEQHYSSNKKFENIIARKYLEEQKNLLMAENNDYNKNKINYLQAKIAYIDEKINKK